MELEVGKYYRTRDGLKAGPAHEVDHRKFPFVAPIDGLGYQAYTAKGCWHFLGKEHRLDLIAEWTDEPAAPQPAGPVRIITRKEIVPGCYLGPVIVHAVDGDSVKISIPPSEYKLKDIRNIISTLSEIADAMEENSK